MIERRFTLALAIWAFGPWQMVCAENRDPFPQYSDKARGWFWKETIPEEEEVEPTQPLPNQSEHAQPKNAEPKAPAEPPPFSTAWMRDSMPKYLDKAIDNPTDENVANYLYLQRFAMDAAERYAEKARRVAMADPMLDENARASMWTGGIETANRMSATNRDKLLRSLAKTFAIWFFFKSDCEFCDAQAPIMGMLKTKYGFSVLPISVDGRDLPNSPFKKFKQDSGQARMLGVDSTPAMFLVRPPDQVVPIGQGMMALDEIGLRIVELGTDGGVVSEEDYRKTRANTRALLPPAAEVGGLGGDGTGNGVNIQEVLRRMARDSKGNGQGQSGRNVK